MNNKYKVNKKIIVLTIIILTIISLSIYVYRRSWYLDDIMKKSNFNKVYNIDDKGIEMAIKSGFIQNVGKFQEKDKLEFIVDNIIVDKKRIVVFYTIKNKGDHKYIKNLDYELYNEKGEKIGEYSSGSKYYDDINLNKVKRIHDSFQLIFSEEIKIPSQINMDIKVEESKYNKQQYDRLDNQDNSKNSKDSYSYSFNIPIDKERFDLKEISYDINENIDIKGQKIFIDNLTVYPTTSILNIKYDKENTMKIFRIEDLKLVDSSEEYTNGIDGVISYSKDEDTQSLYFKSNYFKNDKELYIKGSGINAIEKDKVNVVVDIKNKKLLKAPDSKLKLKEISDEKDSFMREKNSYVLEFEYDKDISFSFEFKDEKGNSFHADSVANSENENYKEIYYMIPKNIEYESPIILKINNYPNSINRTFKVKVK
ncbi:DUF4179 domain-containing protein [Tepidibacter hydrothermalis]|uniref:DUF4179 domain-containing protein n=1 Tax=Tepidibacter hydrothermalis TaxID=3036126 RepID=A0ABY8EAX2_9FIRM|nr:DUF4179 domain-containing protein [Tepidibacter hydrothermalis]WFD10070.1 DUF4179 domain-containing protein [Tepidibacter hydrothermalis]